LLKSYARVHAAEEHEWLVPIFRRVPVAEAADALEGADVVGLSVYVWNFRLSMAIAEEVKRRHPETMIVVGGPHVPDRAAAAEAFLREHPYVDVACHGEGEVVFTALLDRATTREFDDVPGVSYLSSGAFVTHPKAPRLKDLEEIPSPYSGGAFDNLFAARPRDRWVMIWETNRGCPFSCAFCDWGSAVNSKVFRFDMERLIGEIEWMAERNIAFVWTADANFGALKRDLELAERVVDSFKRTGYPSSITVQSTKNATERAYRIQKLLQKEMKAYGVTLSLQSVNDETLAHINRANISSESYRELQRRFAADGVYTYTDLILGLPGESYDAFSSGISKVIAGGQHNQVTLFSCSVLPNAQMGDPEYQARYGMKMQPQAIRSVHDDIEEADWEVEEYLPIIVTTDAMPPADWRRARVLAWIADFTYWDRVLQIPLLILHARHDWHVHELMEALIDADGDAYPVIRGIVSALEEKAVSIQNGGPDYFPIPEAGGLLWPGSQRCTISLVLEHKVDEFYAEVGRLYGSILRERGLGEDEYILYEALTLNQAALVQPFETDNKLLLFSHNIWEHYQSLLVDQPIPIEEGMFVHRVNCAREHWDSIEEWSQHMATTWSSDRRQFLRQVRMFKPRPLQELKQPAHPAKAPAADAAV
jgi:tRNA A37 methylthiotransferase MiaB